MNWPQPKGLVLNINDNGKGFNTFDKSTGIGLKNIKNRAAVYNGKFIFYHRLVMVVK